MKPLFLIMQLEDFTKLMPHLYTWVRPVDVICASTVNFTAVLELKSTGRNIVGLRVLCTLDICSGLQLQFIIFCSCLRVCLPDRKESDPQFIVLPGVCMFKFHNRASTSGSAGAK